MTMPEFDSSAAVFRSGAGQLLKIISLGEPTAQAWNGQDRSAMLRHQLSAPLAFDLAGLLTNAKQSENARSVLSDSASSGIKTFGDLFRHSQPPLAVLKLAKDFFKAKAGPGASRTPQQQVAYSLYLLSIVVARTRLIVSITQLSDQELLPGVDWALNQAWVDECARAHLSEARDLLGHGA